MEALNIMRHESVFNPPDYPYPFYIIGAGATGSRVFAALVELGIPNIHVYDYDIIEDHNLANQIYMATDIGAPKVEGCRNFVRNKLGVVPEKMHFHYEKVTPDLISSSFGIGGVVFILTDTMESRRKIFDALVLRRNSNYIPDNGDELGTTQLISTPLLIIETRMASTHGTIFSINPFNEMACKASH